MPPRLPGGIETRPLLTEARAYPANEMLPFKLAGPIDAHHDQAMWPGLEADIGKGTIASMGLQAGILWAAMPLTQCTQARPRCSYLANHQCPALDRLYAAYIRRQRCLRGRCVGRRGASTGLNASR